MVSQEKIKEAEAALMDAQDKVIGARQAWNQVNGHLTLIERSKSKIQMNKLAIVVILGLATLACANVEADIEDLTMRHPFHNMTSLPRRPIGFFNRTTAPSPIHPNPIQNKSYTLQKAIGHFKKLNNTAKPVLPVNASTTEAVELLAKQIVSGSKNLTQASQVLQVVAALLLTGAQCEQDLGGAFYVAAVIAADAEAGWQDWQQDVIATAIVGMLVYQSSGDCPPVIQIIQELIRIL